MSNKFSLSPAIVVIVVVIFAVFLAVSHGENRPQNRLEGTWDVDDKASWEYQNPGKEYIPSSAELWQDISLQFDTREQTCFVQSALGSGLVRYRIASEGKDNITVNIGEQSFILEFKSNNKIYFCPSNNSAAGCLVLIKEKVSNESIAMRTAKLENRLAEIIKLYTNTIVERSHNFLMRSFLQIEGVITNTELFRLYITAASANNDEATDERKIIIEQIPLMTSMLNEVLKFRGDNVNYARIYTASGNTILFSDRDVPLSEAQLKLIKNAVTTGKYGPIAALKDGDELFFESYFPIFPYGAQGTDTSAVAVLTLGCPVQNLLAQALKFDFRIPQGNLYLIRGSKRGYHVIGDEGVLRETQTIDFADSGELPFARRNSLAKEGEVCSQASYGPAANSWFLFETACISAPGDIARSRE